MSTQPDIALKNNFRKAMKGWIFWHSKCKKYAHSNELVVLIPDQTEDIHYCAAFYLNDLLIQQGKERAVILTCNAEITQKYMRKYSYSVKSIIELTDGTIENLLSYYRLCCFDSRFWVASFDKPFGRNGKLLLEKFPEDSHELFAICVYRLKPYSERNEKYLKGEI